MAKKTTCRNCGEEIMFTWDMKYEKWALVEPFELDPGERTLKREKVKIPFDPKRHKRHYCSNNQSRNIPNNIYRG